MLNDILQHSSDKSKLNPSISQNAESVVSNSQNSLKIN